MMVPLSSMKVERSRDNDKILVDVRFTAKLSPSGASELARILSTNILEIDDAQATIEIDREA